MLGRLRMSIDDCISVYKELGEDIFSYPRPPILHKSKFSRQILETALKKIILARLRPGGRYPRLTDEQLSDVDLYDGETRPGIDCCM